MSAPTPHRQEHPRIDPTEPFPLTPMQQAYWIGRQKDQVLGGAGTCLAYAEIDGHDIDRYRLRKAIHALLLRHEMLRMRLLDDGRQQILNESPWRDLTVRDLRGRPRTDVEQKLRSVRDECACLTLDPAAGRVFDASLTLADDGFSRVHLALDLLAVDGHSLQILLGDLGRLYGNPARPLPPLEYTFRRYLAEQPTGSARDRDSAIRYWRQRLPDLPSRPGLPLAQEPEAITKPTVHHVEHRLSGSDWDLLCGHARARGLTPAMVLATAYAETVGLWSAEPRFLINLPLFNRKKIHPAVPHLVGDFGNLLLLPVDVTATMSFGDRAHAIRSALLGNLQHADFFGVEVLRELTTTRLDTNHAPVVFTYNIRDGESFDSDVRQLGELAYLSGRTPQVWTDHVVLRVGDEIRLIWAATKELFPPDMIDEMAAAYFDVVHRLTEDAAWSRPTAVSLPRPQQQARATANQTAAPESGALLHERFFQRAREHPDRTALVWGDNGHMSYEQLADAALRVAAALTHRNVRLEEPVGIALPRGPEQIAAILGVLASGAAYVPMTGQPRSRRELIARRAGARFVITGSHDDNGSGTQSLIYADALTATPMPGPTIGSPGDLAYVIFTSGSTGEPKGVELTHRAAVNTIDHINTRFAVGEDDRAFAVSSVNFDLSVYDIFGLLSVGGSLVLLDEQHHTAPEAWVELVSHHRVTIWDSVPALLDMLLTAAGPGLSLPDLRLALVSGDWIDLDLPGRVAAATQGRCRFIALGGATEAAVWSNAFEVLDQSPDWPSIPYGFPLGNQHHRVVDQQGRDRPDWVPGELWIGGVGVARGYRGDPDTTASRFVEHAGQRWYRTGDLVRYRPGGILEILGRLDHQVKVQGNRIELGEVEAALRDCQQVARAAVVAAGKGLGRHLVAFIIAATNTIDLDIIRTHMSAAVPSYMAPTRYLIVDELPLNTNGKIDRTTLTAWTSLDTAAAPSEPPRPGRERQLAEEWNLLLTNKVRGRDDNFFALGGNSVLATRLSRVLRAKFGAIASVRDLFTSPTVTEMAALLARRGDDQVTTLENQSNEVS
jgi:amino acid adenylation domain-containing protein